MYSGSEIMGLSDVKALGFNPFTILDIGAHTGQFYNWAHSTWPDAIIWMVEASDIHESVLKSISENYIIAMLGNENKENVNFYTRSDKPSTQGAGYYEEVGYEHLCMTMKKSMKKLDDIFNADTEFSLIKIDTQGAEKDIIEGGRILCKKASVIILEVSYVNTNLGAPLAEEVISFMHDFGFAGELCLGEHYSRESQWAGQIVQRDLAFFNKEKWEEEKHPDFPDTWKSFSGGPELLKQCRIAERELTNLYISLIDLIKPLCNQAEIELIIDKELL